MNFIPTIHSIPTTPSLSLYHHLGPLLTVSRPSSWPGMNSVLRTVDLSTEVLAPVIVGAVMTTAGLAVGGIFIAAWNVGSLLVEYGLLHHLFYSNPHLQKGKTEVCLSVCLSRDKQRILKMSHTHTHTYTYTYTHRFIFYLQPTGHQGRRRRRRRKRVFRGDP